MILEQVQLFRPIIENGQVIDAIVTNTGIGYSSVSVEVRVASRGSNGSFGARVRSLTLNNANRFGDSSYQQRMVVIFWYIRIFSRCCKILKIVLMLVKW